MFYRKGILIVSMPFKNFTLVCLKDEFQGSVFSADAMYKADISNFPEGVFSIQV